MPDLTFVLPHWLYWSGLVVFPLIAMVLAWRQRQRAAEKPGLSLPTAYLLWLCGGFVGIHRFYLASRLGGVYIPIFIAILYGNIKTRGALDAMSGARNALHGAEFDVERFQKAAAQAAEGAAAKLTEAERAFAAASEHMAIATADLDWWLMFSGTAAAIIALLLLVDAALLPGLVRRLREREVADAGAAYYDEATHEAAARVTHRADPTSNVRSKLTDAIDTISGWSGEFVCYWSVIAVFVYYYEVLARYVFNSPTNWAHESMFLMFGMQYLLSGAYALREDAHVRVDVLYLRLSARNKVLVDILTSVFFFIFAGTLLVTGWTFLGDAVSVWEVSFTEWGIQYWPVKISIVLGALLLLLQGVSKLIKDVILLFGRTA